MSSLPNQSISTCLSTIAVSSDILKRLAEIYQSHNGTLGLESLLGLMEERRQLIDGAVATLHTHWQRQKSALHELDSLLDLLPVRTSNLSAQSSVQAADLAEQRRSKPVAPSHSDLAPLMDLMAGLKTRKKPLT